MPYVSPAGPSSQSCLPRKAIASTVLEQTRRKAAAAAGVGKTARPSSSGGVNGVDHAQAQSSTSKSQPVDMSAATSQLANQLEAAHIDEPAIIIPKTLSSASLTPSSSDPASSAVSPTLSTSKSQLSSDSEDAVSAYKASLYTYTVSIINIVSSVLVTGTDWYSGTSCSRQRELEHRDHQDHQRRDHRVWDTPNSVRNKAAVSSPPALHIVIILSVRYPPA